MTSKIKVYLTPSFSKKDRGEGGIRRVVEAQIKHLPSMDVEIVSTPQEADLVNGHATDSVKHPVFVHSCHGLYWDDWEWGGWAYQANARVVELMNHAQAVTTPSDWVANAVRRGMLIDPIVCSHGIDLSEWTPAPTDGFVLFAKNRPDPVCDPGPMLRLAALAPQVPFVGTFGGEAPNITLTGRLPFSKTKELIQTAGVYLATVLETGGITVLESMASGVPILGWRWGANEEIVTHLENGYLADPEDYDDLLEGLHYCLNNRDRLGSAARAYVADNRQWEQMIGSYRIAYERALGIGVSSNPKISVIVRAYNLEKYLPACLDSVLAQTTQDWEVVVVDDASPDRCGEIADQYAEQDQRIKVVHNASNQYIAEAMNTGVRASKGKYVIALDADDRFAPHTLDILSSALDSGKADIVTGAMQVFWPDGKVGVSQWPPDDPNYAEQAIKHNQLPYASMYSRYWWDRVGGYRRRCRTAEDPEFWLRLMSYGATAAKVTDAPCLLYTVRPDSVSNSQQEPDWTAWFPWTKIPDMAPYGTSTNGHHIHMYGPPSISVVIPCGPGHDFYLQDVLDSLIAQTFINWEAIVVNDTGVSWYDDQGKLVNKYLEGFPFVRVVEESDPHNRGVSWARNAGIRASKASRFVLMDADDYMQPLMLDVLFKVSTMYGGWVYSDWYKDDSEVQSAQDWSADELLVKMLGPITGIYNKADWATVGGFDEEAPNWEDWSFQLSMLEHSICGTHVAQPLFTYRYRTGNRREEGFANGANVLKYIKSKHKNLFRRETIMACRGCGGGGGQSAVKVGVAAPPSGSDPMVMVEYIGQATQTMTLTSKVNRARRYRFGGEKGSVTRKFFAYEADISWITEMVDFQRVKMTDVSIKTPERLPVLQDSTPAPSMFERPISDLDLPAEITTALARAGYMTVGDVKPLSLGELVTIRGLGPARARRLQDAIAHYT
jgi:glycosyltransferase involved in cell wall biosynthesis